MGGVAAALWNGVRLRCPHCGEGRIFARYLKVDEGCLECSHVYQRDPGDWTGSAETTVILSAGVALVLALVLRNVAPFKAMGLMWTGFLLWVSLFPLVFRRVKGLWVGLLYLWNGRCPVPDVSAARKAELVRLRSS
ncbi:MAG TPA: DUF983 domain-containing protein [Candidatus Thermoplasmatota archaeon]|nr:DUF983 domain-containing protein [Candidatus Thermoplasmatota archaeon]